jgi:ribosomal protein S18 acetylase RimI-like enzyme
MEVRSLGYRTDLALLQLGGSLVEDRGDHLVVRTPQNPGYWWGNFLLLDRAPTPASHWLARFAVEFPDARHLAIGVDSPDGTVADLDGFAAAGLRVDSSTVMTADAVRPPAHPNTDAEYRALTSDDDWAQRVELRVAAREVGHSEASYRDHAVRTSAVLRRLTEAGHGAWFGAFLGGRLVASMGLIAAGGGLARFQAVETHPDTRRRGLAGTLVHHTARYGFGRLGVRTLVMVADPDDVAIRIYRSLGFTGTETQLQAERPAPDS